MIDGVIGMKRPKPIRIKNGDTTIKFNFQAFQNWKDLAQELHNTSVAIGAGDLKVAKITEPHLKRIAELCVDFENFWAAMALMGNGSQLNMRMVRK